MTILTPMEGLTAPMHAADPAAALAAAALLDDDDGYEYDFEDHPVYSDIFARDAVKAGPQYITSRRADGWTPDRQRAFLDCIAQGHVVSEAAARVGLSAASAYAFRQRAAGAAFAVGWQAALLLQRNRLVDDLTTRAFAGQTDVYTRADGTQVQRHRHDNRLALALLTRLDRIAAADLPDRTGDARAARLAAQDWDRYLDLIAADASPAHAGMFLALRVTEGEAHAIAPIAALARADLYCRTGAGHAAEIDIADLDPARRAAWTADQWTRAEAAGLVALAPAPPEDDAPADSRGNSQLSQHSRLRTAQAEEDDAEDWDEDEDYDDDEDDDDDSMIGGPLWFCDKAGDWRTHFPPPADFNGVESGLYGSEEYERSLSGEEFDLLIAWRDARLESRRVEEEAERTAFFARLEAGQAAAAHA